MTQFYLGLKKHKYKKCNVINFIIFKIDSFRKQINIKNFILHILVVLFTYFILCILFVLLNLFIKICVFNKCHYLIISTKVISVGLIYLNKNKC